MDFWLGKLLTNVKFGHVIIIGGVIKPNPNKLTITLSEDPIDIYNSTISDHIILQLTARFKERQITRASHVPYVGWTEEQISENLACCVHKNPLIPSEKFVIRIVVLQIRYEIYINDELYCIYHHCCDVKKFNYIEVGHDFEKVTVFDHHSLYPRHYPLPFTEEDKNTVYNSDIPESLRTGNSIFVKALPAGKPTAQFSIDFVENETKLIVFRFCVRFDLKSVIRTAQRKDFKFYDNDQETGGEFPFKRGRIFKIAFFIQDECFHVLINGKHFTNFNHRYPYKEISTIRCVTDEGGSLMVKSFEYHNDILYLNNVQELTKL